MTFQTCVSVKSHHTHSIPLNVRCGLCLDMLVVFLFYLNKKFAICTLWQNKQNHTLRFMLSLIPGGSLVFPTIPSHLPRTITTFVAWKSVCVELFLLKRNPSVQFT